MILTINGTKVQLIPPDLDGDGITGGIEKVYEHGTEAITQPTELGESMKSLDDDSVDPNSKMSRIDFNARIHHVEKPSLDVFDALVSMGMLTKKCQFLSLIKKRNSVSEDGKGREEKVAMVVGKREQDAKTGGMLQKAGQFLGLKAKTEQPK